MWPNPRETADLITFTEETLNGNFIFCAVGILEKGVTYKKFVKTEWFQWFTGSRFIPKISDINRLGSWALGSTKFSLIWNSWKIIYSAISLKLKFYFFD